MSPDIRFIGPIALFSSDSSLLINFDSLSKVHFLVDTGAQVCFFWLIMPILLLLVFLVLLILLLLFCRLPRGD